MREASGLLGMEIDDVLFAIRQKDVPWVRRFLTRLPTLVQARDAHGKPLSEHATESGNDEIARLFETASGQR